MPYISKERRAAVQHWGPVFDSPGDMNYYITKAIADWLPDYPSYADFNTVIGVLECAKLELYRRMVAPYEDQKIEENGDVY